MHTTIQDKQPSPTSAARFSPDYNLISRELLAGVSVQGVIKPADGELVSGDVARMYQLGEGKFLILLADALAHGTEAFKLATYFSESMQRIIKKMAARYPHHDPEAVVDSILHLLNRHLLGGLVSERAGLIEKSNPTLVTSSLVFVDGVAFDHQENRMFLDLTLGVAGNPPPLLHHSDSESVLELSQARGSILGADKSRAMFSIQKLRLYDGDELYLTTDGLPDSLRGVSTNLDEPLTLQRFIQRGRTSLAFCFGGILNALKGHEQRDDISLLRIRFSEDAVLKARRLVA